MYIKESTLDSTQEPAPKTSGVCNIKLSSPNRQDVVGYMQVRVLDPFDVYELIGTQRVLENFDTARVMFVVDGNKRENVRVSVGRVRVAHGVERVPYVKAMKDELVVRKVSQL